jgi:predicted PurR-regulated permease PerM
LWLVGAPLAFVIGPLAGILSLVPYLGLVVGAGLSLALAAVEYQDFAHSLGVVIVFVVAQNIEGWWLTPKLLGRSVGLHPVWVLVALLLGGELFGLPGVIVAVPVAAALGVVIAKAVDTYHKSAFYLGAEAAAGSPGKGGDK